MVWINPLRRVVPPGWDEEFPVNAFEYQQEEARYLGGYRKLLRRLLPLFERHSVEAGGPGWSIFGPRWSTRTLSEDEEWCLFLIEHTDMGWRVEGLQR